MMRDKTNNYTKKRTTEMASPWCGETPRVSVIVPVYNVLPYLREALDSVVHQTWRNLEILIIDDGSTDGSGEVCDEYAGDPRVKVIHQENKGLSGTRNTGLDQMTGEYVAFLDSDDAFHPEMIEQLYNALTKNHADLAACSYDIYGTNGPLKASKRKECFCFREETVITTQEAICAMTEGKFSVVSWNKLFPKNLWKELRYPEGLVYEDIWTIPRILEQCDCIAVIPNVLVYHRDRDGSITKTYTAGNILDFIHAHKAFQGCIEQFQPALPPDKIRKCREFSLCSMMLRWENIRRRKPVTEGVELLREKILDFAGQDTDNRSSTTQICLFLFRHCHWMFIPAYTCYRDVKKIFM